MHRSGHFRVTYPLIEHAGNHVGVEAYGAIGMPANDIDASKQWSAVIMADVVAAYVVNQPGVQVREAAAQDGTIIRMQIGDNNIGITELIECLAYRLTAVLERAADELEVAPVPQHCRIGE